MSLTNVEREKITDSVLKIQSVRASLEDIDEKRYRTRGRLRVVYNV